MAPIADEMAAAEKQIVSQHQIHEKVVNEEFKIWKKTVPLLYNTIYTRSMKWPSLTVDFNPKYTVSNDKNSILVSFVTGTNTSSREQDTVSLCSLKLPSTLAPDYASFAVGECIPIPLANPENSDYNVTKSWSHAGEVNRAKFSPNGEKFVTFDNAGTVHLYNITEDAPVDFSFHTQEGYCLEWTSDDQFLSGANDCQIALWDIASKASPLRQYNTHGGVINDISYSRPTGVLFGSVADDFTTQIHDLRNSEESPAIKFHERHLQNAIQFHPDIDYLFATGGKDNVVNVYDARSTKSPIRKLYGHNDSIFGLRWDNADPLLLYSWGLDKHVITWDLNYLAEDYTPSPVDPLETKRKTKYNEDPCLHFVHAGHTNRVNDLAVHPTVLNLFATVGDDTLLEIFQPKTLNEGGDHEDEDDEEEEEEEPEEEQNSEEKQSPNEDADENPDSKQLDKEDLDEDNDENEDEDLIDSPMADGVKSVSALNVSGKVGITSQPPVEEDQSNSDVDMAE